MKQQRIIQNFEVILEPEDDGGYHISCPALKGCHTYRATKEEAMEKIKEAIELWLESANELGIRIPERETVTIEVLNNSWNCFDWGCDLSAEYVVINSEHTT